MDRESNWVRIPSDGDRDSWMIVISVPTQDDQRFRVDRDQLIVIPGTVITMPRNVFHRVE
jgi:hypothetical protein